MMRPVLLDRGGANDRRCNRIRLLLFCRCGPWLFPDRRSGASHFPRGFHAARDCAVSVLVTGAAGFIGFHVASALLARGEQVYAFDNLNSYYSVALKRARLAE